MFSIELNILKYYIFFTFGRFFSAFGWHTSEDVTHCSRAGHTPIVIVVIFVLLYCSKASKFVMIWCVVEHSLFIVQYVGSSRTA